MRRVVTKHIGVRVPVELGERLEALARRENNHVSAVTRRLLSAALDREDVTRGPVRSNGAATVVVRRYTLGFGERRREPSAPTTPVPINNSDAGSGVGAGPDGPLGVRSKVKRKPPCSRPLEKPPCPIPPEWKFKSAVSWTSNA